VIRVDVQSFYTALSVPVCMWNDGEASALLGPAQEDVPNHWKRTDNVTKLKCLGNQIKLRSKRDLKNEEFLIDLMTSVPL
jgi:hypothetical protein